MLKIAIYNILCLVIGYLLIFGIKNRSNNYVSKRVQLNKIPLYKKEKREKTSYLKFINENCKNNYIRWDSLVLYYKIILKDPV